MTCPTELTCSRFVDAALTQAEAAEFSAHMKTCRACATRVEAFAAEREVLSLAMQGAAVGGVIPPFVPRPTISRLFVWLSWAALGIWSISTVWMSLADAVSLPSWLAWLSPDTLGVGIQLVVAVLLQATGSGDIFTGAIATARSLIVAVAALAAFGWLVRQQPARTASLCVSLGLLSTLMLAAPDGHAIELRHGEDRVIVQAGEVIDDTLIITAEDITIDGEVTGDLIAFGETVTIRGRIGGLLIAMGETVNLEGAIAHSVLGMGETVEARDAQLGGNLFGMGESVIIHPGTQIAGNGVLAAADLEVNGEIARDFLGLARTITLLGGVTGNVKAYGGSVELTPTARVGGDLSAKTRDTNSAVIAPEAAVAGDTDLTAWPEERSRYASPGFYFGEILHLLAALITGLVLFRALPVLANTKLESGTEALTTAGIGAIALIATPVLAFAALITLIGAPLGILALLLWGAALYMAGIVIARYLGSLLLTNHEDRPTLPLLLGLAILLIITNLPLIGDPIQLVAVIVGLGMIANWLRDVWATRSSD